jgi:hypothetical protein
MKKELVSATAVIVAIIIIVVGIVTQEVRIFRKMQLADQCIPRIEALEKRVGNLETKHQISPR